MFLFGVSIRVLAACSVFSDMASARYVFPPLMRKELCADVIHCLASEYLINIQKILHPLRLSSEQI